MRTLIRSLKGHLKWTSLFVLVLALGCPSWLECDEEESPVAPPVKKSAFTFEVSPPNVGLEPGSTTMATVSIDRDPGASGTDFSGDIAFSVSDLPQGVTGVFSPNPVPGSVCTLTVSCTPSAPLGSSTATITATSGTDTETLSLQVAVTGAGGDYSLSVTPAITRLLRKQSTTRTFTVDITRLGYEGAIELGVGLGIPPCNILASFWPRFDPAAPTGNTSQLTLELSSSPLNVAGVCTLYVTGRQGGLPVRRTPLTVEVSPWSKVFEVEVGGFSDVAFINTNTATAVIFRRIIRTINGGDTWVDQDGGTTNTLKAVHFIDANVGFAVGYNGTIIRTINGGDLWTVQASGTPKDLRGVHFYNDQIGTAVGNLGTIIHTIDSGTTWENQSIARGNDLYDVFVINANVAIAVGDKGVILRTVDGGSRWEYERHGSPDVPPLRQVCFIDDTTGMVAGLRGGILRTLNGGQTWPWVSIGMDRVTYGVAFVDANTGYVSLSLLGGEGRLGIYRTTDGGQTWDKEYGDAWHVRNLSAVDGETVMAIAGSRILRRDGPE